MKEIRMLAAIMFTDMGEWEKVFNLNYTIDEKLGSMKFINDKYWKELHDQPRFKEILQRMNLPLE